MAPNDNVWEMNLCADLMPVRYALIVLESLSRVRKVIFSAKNVYTRTYVRSH